MDSIAAAESGHLGLPLGCAEIGAILFGTDSGLSYNPSDPQWLNRDRFVLSAGHGSMFLYSWLHMAGYDIPMEEVKNFRQHHSMTPGHPEYPSSHHVTPGIESTTGPLGQVRPCAFVCVYTFKPMHLYVCIHLSRCGFCRHGRSLFVQQ